MPDNRGMKETVPCTGCSQCCKGYAVGFTGGAIMHCLLLDMETTADDGCTHGTPGEPVPLVYMDSVYLNGHEAVMGWHE